MEIHLSILKKKCVFTLASPRRNPLNEMRRKRKTAVVNEQTLIRGLEGGQSGMRLKMRLKCVQRWDEALCAYRGADNRARLQMGKPSAGNGR